VGARFFRELTSAACVGTVVEQERLKIGDDGQRHTPHWITIDEKFLGGISIRTFRFDGEGETWGRCLGASDVTGRALTQTIP
jgi:hypothetical protein